MPSKEKDESLSMQSLLNQQPGGNEPERILSKSEVSSLKSDQTSGLRFQIVRLLQIADVISDVRFQISDFMLSYCPHAVKRSSGTIALS